MRLPQVVADFRPGLGTGAVCLASGAVLLLADLLSLPAAPSPFLLLRYGLLGSLVQTSLLLAAALAAGAGRTRSTPHLFHAVTLGLLLAPMAGTGGWEVPLVAGWRWAVSGSPDGTWAAAAGSAAVLAAAAHWLLSPLPRARPAAAWGLAAVALALPWASLVAGWALYGSAAWSRSLLSALAHTAAFPLLAWGWRHAGPASTGHRDLPAETRESLAAAADVLPIAALLAAYLALKLETVSFSATDENIYFYAARLFAGGSMPYRDFFFAHPPLHVVIPGAAAMLLGHGFTLMKLLPVAFSALSGLFLYRIGRDRAGRFAGLAAAAIFLFALEQLQASTNLTGINLTVMFLCASAWFAATGRGLASGLLAGLALLSGVYAAGPALSLAAVAFFASTRCGLLFLAGLAATAGGGNLLFYALFDASYVDQVYRYHFLKPPKVEGFLPPRPADLAALAGLGAAFVAACRLAGAFRDRARAPLRSFLRTRAVLVPAVVLATGLALAVALTAATDGVSGAGLLLHDFGRFVQDKEFLRFFAFHPHLVIAPAILAAALAVGRMAPAPPGPTPTGGLRVALTGLCLFAAALVELSILAETYTFYYVLAIPGAALMLGLAWSHALRPALAARPGPEGRPESTLRTLLRPAASMLLAVCSAWILSAFVPVGHEVAARRFPHAPAGLSHKERAALPRGTEVAGDLVCYDIKDNVRTPFSDWIRTHLLTTCRVAGGQEPGVYHYLWKKKWYLSRAEEIADYIRAESAPDETIIGSSLIAPLFSMLSGRDLAARFVDTNTKRFKTGMVGPPDAWRTLCDRLPDLDEDACRRIAAEREMWRQVCRTPLRFIVAGPRSFFTPQRMAGHPLVRKHFRPVRFFNEPHLNMEGDYQIVLFRRVSAHRLRDGSWCDY